MVPQRPPSHELRARWLTTLAHSLSFQVLYRHAKHHLFGACELRQEYETRLHSFERKTRLCWTAPILNETLWKLSHLLRIVEGEYERILDELNALLHEYKKTLNVPLLQLVHVQPLISPAKAQELIKRLTRCMLHRRLFDGYYGTIFTAREATGRSSYGNILTMLLTSPVIKEAEHHPEPKRRYSQPKLLQSLSDPSCDRLNHRYQLENSLLKWHDHILDTLRELHIHNLADYNKGSAFRMLLKCVREEEDARSELLHNAVVDGWVCLPPDTDVTAFKRRHELELKRLQPEEGIWFDEAGWGHKDEDGEEDGSGGRAASWLVGEVPRYEDEELFDD